jgi:putative ABC transport system permease protein
MENVRSIELRSVYVTRMYIGQRRNEAVLIGVMDFSVQTVDRVKRDSGEIPNGRELMTDVGNERTSLFNGGIGDRARIYDSNGEVQDIEITGRGHCLYYSDYPTWGAVVFYAGIDLVNSMANTTGINMISIDLMDQSEDSAKRTIERIEDYLESNTGFKAFMGLPEIRSEGEYPGRDIYLDIMSFFYVPAVMTVICSLFLISNTMHTIIVEQRREIAQMKAIGATRLQVLRSYLRTNFVMGLIGSVIGAFMGVFIAYVIGLFLLDSFFGMTLPFSIHPPTIFLSILLGITIIIVAGLPALLMSLRTTVKNGMEDRGMTNGSDRHSLTRAFMGVPFIPRTLQMSVRNITRKKGRSFSTIVQVALAVGLFCGFTAIGHTVSVGVEEIFEEFGSDIETYGQMTGGNPLTEDLQPIIEDIDGVDRVEPFIMTKGFLNGIEFNLFGYLHDPFIYRIERTMVNGRWFDQRECSSGINVMVLNKFLAKDAGVRIGDVVEIELATGSHPFEVIGLDSGFGEWGRTAFAPIDTLQDILILGDIVSGFGVITTTGEHGLIDRVSTDIEDTMLENGYVVNNNILYLEWEEAKQFNMNIINVMIAVGVLVMLITLIGLMSTLTMNVIERTKEIGMLRCLGSSSRSIRSIFGGEGLVLSLFGWILGMPLGYLVGRFLNYMSLKLMNSDFDLVFPVRILFIAGLVTLVMTIVVIQPPLWRATHLKPGEALRYE